MPIGRIVIIPFLHGKLTDDDTLIEPDIDDILERWLDRHPEFRGRNFHIIRSGKSTLHDGIVTTFVRVTTDFSADLEGYDAAIDADLYEEFLADDGGVAPSDPRKIWTDQCEAARGIEDEFGVQKALNYLIGEKFLNSLEVAETDVDYRAEIPAFVAKIKVIFERWQLAQYLETTRETQPFAPELFEPQSSYLLGEEEIEFDAEEVDECGRTTFANVLVTCCWSSGRGSGCWRRKNEPRKPRRSQDRPGTAKTSVSGLRRATDRNPCEAPVLPLPHNLRDML